MYKDENINKFENTTMLTPLAFRIFYCNLANCAPNNKTNCFAERVLVKLFFF